mgnify:CR=1 FL=1
MNVGVESPMSVPSYVNISPLDAPDCNPGILKEVILASPKVISLFAFEAEGAEFAPIIMLLFPLTPAPPELSPTRTLSSPDITVPADLPTATLLSPEPEPPALVLLIVFHFHNQEKYFELHLHLPLLYIQHMYC